MSSDSDPSPKPSPVRELRVPAGGKGQRLDLFLSSQLENVSRSRVQLLLAQHGVEVDGRPGKASYKLRGGERIAILDQPALPALRAFAEDIPLTIVYEDADLAVIDKPAGMMVHAGAGATESERNRGTLVNALLHHVGALSSAHLGDLSSAGGELRPGIVHRLDKQTSGLIVVAKNDAAHAKLSAMFARRQVRKVYLVLVHGSLPRETGTIDAAIGRDRVRRTRMTARREGGRAAVSHWRVVRRLEGPYGNFTLAEVRIESGRTHQIRVHMASIDHPVVGDALYGAPAALPRSGEPPHSKLAASLAKAPAGKARQRRLPAQGSPVLKLGRNFLHAAELGFAHPRTGKALDFRSKLPSELEEFLAQLTQEHFR